MGTMRKFLINVFARKYGSIGIFENYEITVKAIDEDNARRDAITDFINRGFETRGTSILQEKIGDTDD